jgi:uncharacterized lipoprotein YmbA
MLLSVFLCSCAQSPVPEVNYYLLDTPNVTAKNLANNNQQKSILIKNNNIIIDDILLPQYLKQSSIVMLIGENRLHYAHYNLWGENLEQGVSKLIQQSIGQINSPEPIHLTIEIDHFYPTVQGKVILFGRYELTLKKEKKTFMFAFTETLNTGGYGEAVKKMQLLIKTLAKNIISNVKVF